jgi:hypothetical protein
MPAFNLIGILIRRTLTPAQRAKLTAKRKAAFECQ